MEGRCFAAEARIPKYLTRWKRGAGTRATSFSTKFIIAHDHVRCAVAPGCFHPIREAAAGKTLQTLDSQWRSDLNRFLHFQRLARYAG
jgi:hypothetical protein